MILETLFVPDILSQHIEGLVARLVGHLEEARAIAGGAREKAAAQAMAGVAARLEPDLAGEILHASAATVLALGGGSWARLGSDGGWLPWLTAR